MTSMVHNRAKYSIVTQPVAPLTSHQIQVMGTTGTLTVKKFCQSSSCEFGGCLIRQEISYMPEGPAPFVDRSPTKIKGSNLLCSQSTCHSHI